MILFHVHISGPLKIQMRVKAKEGRKEGEGGKEDRKALSVKEMHFIITKSLETLFSSLIGCHVI